MGIYPNISYNKFPEQNSRLFKRTKVCFNYDTNNIVMGTIIRDDNKPPYVTIIQLDNDRVVLTTECQHSSRELNDG